MEWFNWLHQHYQTDWRIRMSSHPLLTNTSFTTINIQTISRVTQRKMIDGYRIVVLISSNSCFHWCNGKLYMIICVKWKLKYLKEIILEVVLGVYRRKTFIIWTWLLAYTKKRLNQWKLFLFLQLTEQDGGSVSVGWNKCLLQEVYIAIS